MDNLKSVTSTERTSGLEVRNAQALIGKVKGEVSKIFFGHAKIVDSVVKALLCNGHVLIEGVPGVAKTLLIKTIAKVSGCSSSRIQFTVDLLPTDITGLTTYDPKRGFEVVKGPIFANLVVADEINRSPPKTQSALIEAMQEGQVTIGKTTYVLPKPFFVMANQNPLENEGVYPLPEAQIDRFIFKILFDYPEQEDEKKVMEQNVTFTKFEDTDVRVIISAAKILELQNLTQKIYLDERIKQYIIDIVTKTRKKDFKYGEYIELGASPRASIYLYIAAKAEAVMNGRTYVLPSDIDNSVFEVLRHRLILSYRARAENVDSDKIIAEILKSVTAPI